MGIIIALFFYLSVEVVVQIKKLKLPALVYAWLIQSTFKQKKRAKFSFYNLFVDFIFFSAVLCYIVVF